MKITLLDKLTNEFRAAIIAVYGEDAEKPADETEISKDDLESIARKVAFYVDAE